ncbi:FAD-dependent oxidoreductase [Kaistella sp. DKR-2]|uniref:FAD-dependent oxidoreductase n=1 Tax=Kaistella soli TaxID=2849654 RepID=UPI001C25ECAF|nr:FAD-dependent oxidoreductase [Kaistella soli]MBU8882652.1 FAD-dependent oxidoreductase [Kaistella soli]
MKRDGTNKSIWQDDSSFLQNTAEIPDTVDTVIVGAGLTGISLAFELQKRGQRCLVIEQHGIGSGTTGGTTAHINNFFDVSYDHLISRFGSDAAGVVAENALKVVDIVAQNIEECAISCDFDRCSFYLLSTEEKHDKQLANIYAAHQELGIPGQRVTEIPFRVPFREAIEIEGQAQFHPLKYITALAHEFEVRGGAILLDTRIRSHKTTGDGVEVQTEFGRKFTAKNLVWATHIPPGITRFSTMNAPYRSYALAAKIDGSPMKLAQGADLCDPYHYFRYQLINGAWHIIIGGFDHKTGHEEDTVRPFEALKAYAHHHFTFTDIVAQWSAQYYVPVDGLPYIGKMPGEDRVFIATGYNGNGMTWGTLAAGIIADLIDGTESRLAETVSPSRLEFTASAREFVKENADVVFHLIKDRFAADKKAELDSLKKGEGKIIVFEGKNVAAYRDEEDALKLLTAACPHMGCTVRFNTAEKTWDCPCHGSRFDTDGNLLTAPATENLKPINL